MTKESSTLIWQSSKSTVYLELAHGEKTIRKTYKLQEDLSNELAIYNILSKTSLNTPKVISHDKGHLFLSYIDGKTLRDFVDSRTQKGIFYYLCTETTESNHIREQLLETVKKLHENGIAHGNLKQSQFIIDNQNTIYILDFADSVTVGHPYFTLFKKYDLDVLRSYLKGVPARRPSKPAFFLARLSTLLSRFLCK